MTLKSYPGTRFSCGQCGDCCSGWNVDVDPDYPFSLDYTTLFTRFPHLREYAELPSEFRKKRLLPAFFGRNGDKINITRINSECVFRDRDAGCCIHSALGYQAKPAICRSFPHFLMLSPIGPQVTVSLHCSGYCSSFESGRPVDEVISEKEPELRKNPGAYWPKELSLDSVNSLSSTELPRLAKEIMELCDSGRSPFGVLTSIPWLPSKKPGQSVYIRDTLEQVLDWAEGIIDNVLSPLRLQNFVDGQKNQSWCSDVFEHLNKAMAELRRRLAGMTQEAMPELGIGLDVFFAIPRRTAKMERYLIEVIRRFTLNCEFERFPNFTTAYGALLVSLMLVLCASASLEKGDSLEWVGRTMAHWLRQPLGDKPSKDVKLSAALSDCLTR